LPAEAGSAETQIPFTSGGPQPGSVPAIDKETSMGAEPKLLFLLALRTEGYLARVGQRRLCRNPAFEFVMGWIPRDRG
jgi:hypothetical protein